MPELPYRPWTMHGFGVEFEMRKLTTDNRELDQDDIRDAIRPTLAGPYLSNRRAAYYHSDGTTWDIKTDSSCGWELASRALKLNEAGHNEEMKSALTGLATARPLVDGQCGTHVHIDTGPHYTWEHMKQLVILWTRYEPFFYELQPPARRTSVYCEPLRSNTWDRHHIKADNWVKSRRIIEMTATNAQQTIENADRLSLFIKGWWRHRRIEVRLHSGTTNYEKIRHWIMLMNALVHRPLIGPSVRHMELPERMESLPTDYICKQLGLVRSSAFPNVGQEAEELVSWLERRRQQFSPGSGRGSPLIQVPAEPVRVAPERTRGGRRYDRTPVAEDDPNYVNPNAGIDPVRFRTRPNGRVEMEVEPRQ